MKTRWFQLLSGWTLVVALTCVGCGTTSAPEDAQSSDDYTQEIQKEDPSLRGEKPADVYAPDEKPAEKP